MRIAKSCIAGDEVFDDFAPVRGDGDDEGIGEDEGEGLGVHAEFVDAGMAHEEEDVIVDVFDTGEFVFV